MKGRIFLLSALVAVVLLPGNLAAQGQVADDFRALWNGLASPVLDAEKIAIVEGVELQRDAAQIHLGSGQLALVALDSASPGAEGRAFAAVFKGSGHLRFAPTLALEKQQVAFHSGNEVLEDEFKEAVFLFTDDTMRHLAPQLEFRAGDVDELQDIYKERLERWAKYGLNWEPRLLKAFLATNPEHHALFVAELNTREYNWLTLIVDAADPEEVELVRFDSGRRSRDIWAKFPREERTPQEAFADPLARYDYVLRGYQLDITVEKNTEMMGEAQVSLEVVREGERVLLFALDPNLRVSQVTDAAGQKLAFFQPEDPKDDYFLGDYLVVVSEAPFANGPAALHFTYSGKRVVRKVGNGNFFCRSFGWYPTYGAGRYSITTNEFAGRYDFDLTLRTPKKYEVVAVGERVEDQTQDDYRVTRWKSEMPLAVAGFAFGDYKVREESVGDTQVQVYANKSADDTLSAIELLASSSEGTVGLHNLSPSQLADEMAVEISNSLKVMEMFFGPYPYKKLAVSNIPYSYGQGWPSLLYISALSFLDSTQRHQLGIREHRELTDFFRAHETSHQWWGHVVGWKSYHDQWLSEGFAEFSGMLYTMYRRDPKEYLRMLRQRRESLMQKDRQGAVYEQIGSLYAGRRLSSSKHPGGYGTVVYEKGGWVLHMIRMMLYDIRNKETPDHRFIAMMKDFTQTFHNKPASTEDFKAVVEKHMTRPMDIDRNGKMDWFFDSWVYGTGIPKFKFTYQLEPGTEKGQYILKGRLDQSNVPDNFRMIVPLFLHQKGRSFRVGWITSDREGTSFEVPLAFKPDKVTINEWEDVLATVD